MVRSLGILDGTSVADIDSELRAELQLPVSGLLDFRYPDLFPTLSFPGSSRLHSPDVDMGSEGSPASHNLLEPEEERSWLYYLAEISLRKIMNRILEIIYSKGEEAWMTNIQRTISHHGALHEELLSWRNHLPEQLQFSDDGMPPNELAFFLQTRYLGCLLWMHTPFLYYFSTRSDESDSCLARVAPLAQKCVDVCTALIPNIASHHRHGGIWALLRRSFGCSVLLVVAAKTNRPDLLCAPQDWEELLRLSVRTIHTWGKEAKAADLEWMGNLLLEIAS